MTMFINAQYTILKINSKYLAENRPIQIQPTGATPVTLSIAEVGVRVKITHSDCAVWEGIIRPMSLLWDDPKFLTHDTFKDIPKITRPGAQTHSYLLPEHSGYYYILLEAMPVNMWQRYKQDLETAIIAELKVMPKDGITIVDNFNLEASDEDDGVFRIDRSYVRYLGRKGQALTIENYEALPEITSGDLKIHVAACRCFDKDGKAYVIIGTDHWDDIMLSQYRNSTFVDMVTPDMLQEGFIDTDGDWHGRQEALAIAKAVGQLKDGISSSDKLYTYMLK